MAQKTHFTILYGGLKRRGSQPFSDIELDDAYASFLDLAPEYGLTASIVQRKWYTKGGFDRSWIRKKGQWQLSEKRLKPKLIMDKEALGYDELNLKMELPRMGLTINPWGFDLIASDKLLTSATFHKIVTPTYLVRDLASLKQAVTQIGTKEVVIKPRLGSGGKGIQIVRKSKIQDVQCSELSIVQPFVDTSAGIPGLYKGIHDYRVVFVGNKPVVSYIRTPAPGTRLCNISQGGGVIMVPISKMPKSLKPLIKSALSTLSIFPYKAFSLDFFFDHKKKPHLVEVNTKPIMAFPAGFRKTQDRMHHAYLKYFASLV
jgi:hypothetical protein